MKYVVIGKSSEEMIWMGKSTSPEEAVRTALAFSKCLPELGRFFEARPIVSAKSIQEKALEWAKNQPGIETLEDAIFAYAEDRKIHIDWTYWTVK